jgi:osmoprotectant transport system ATP-binding protein
VFSEGGHLEQYDAPTRLLGSPATDFVASFVGADRGLKRLSLTRLDELELQPANGAVGPLLDGQTTLRDALSTMLNEGTRNVLVEAGDGTKRVLTLDRLTELLK